MTNLDHPSKIIELIYTDSIRKAAKEAEHLRRLHPDQLSIIIKQNWLNMFVPKKYGGLELTLSEGVRIEECLSWADGSTGWVVTLCSGAAWFSGFLNPEILKQVFAERDVCFAGSGASTGTARLIENGYEVSGYWKYASGSLHATVFTANCVLVKDGKPLHNDDGTPVVRAFLFTKEEVNLHLTWKGMGMVATGTHDFEVKKLMVGHNRCFHIDPGHAVVSHALYQFPFHQLAEVTLAANLSGMSVRFLDLVELTLKEKMEHEQFTESQKIILKKKLSETTSWVMDVRQKFYNELDRSWEICNTGKLITGDQLASVSLCSHQLVAAARQCVVELYPYCGLSATNTETEINRVWRNFNTASQHALFTSAFLAHDQ